VLLSPGDSKKIFGDSGNVRILRTSPETTQNSTETKVPETPEKLPEILDFSAENTLKISQMMCKRKNISQRFVSSS